MSQAPPTIPEDVAAQLGIKPVYSAPDPAIGTFLAAKNAADVAAFKALINEQFPYLHGFPEIATTQFVTREDPILRKAQATALFSARIGTYLRIELDAFANATSDEQRNEASKRASQLVSAIIFSSGAQFFAAEEKRKEAVRQKHSAKPTTESLFDEKEAARLSSLAKPANRYDHLRRAPASQQYKTTRQKSRSPQRQREQRPRGSSEEEYESGYASNRSRGRGRGRRGGRGRQ